MRKKAYIVFCFLMVGFLMVNAQIKPEIQKKTFLYSVKGGDSLFLDRYDVPSFIGPKPCIIYVFGGSFARGNRASIGIYADYLAKLGYMVVSIDYRLGLKNLKVDQISDYDGFITTFSRTIDMAVEDLFDATNYVVDHAREWGVYPDSIITNGSSAGAIISLEGEYEICNKGRLASKLPEGFNYAGVIAFAGALFSTDSDLKWPVSPVPMLLFHGEADSNVPYHKLECFYGSKYISDQLTALKVPHCFYSVDNAAHELSSTPTTSNRKEIEMFLQKLVREKQRLIIATDVKKLDGPPMRKDFDMMDFLEANFKK